jgi:hypothetical protein
MRERFLLLFSFRSDRGESDRFVFNSRSFEPLPMFHGDRTFNGSPVLSDIALFVGFLTTVLYFAQDPVLEIPILDVIQTLCCWPSFLEGLLITFCLWAFRHIERMLSVNGLIAFFIYNAITYALPFLFVLKVKGFHARFPLFGFVPHSLYIFMLWRLPAVMFTEPLTDKFVITLAMLLVITGRFPYSLLSLLAAAGGYWTWNCDFFHIRKLFTVQNPEISMLAPPLEPEETTETNDGALQGLLDMGISPAEARTVLDAHGGDPETALQALFE